MSYICFLNFTSTAVFPDHVPTLVRTRRSRSDKGNSRDPLFSMPRGSTSHRGNDDDDEEEDTSRVNTPSP